MTATVVEENPIQSEQESDTLNSLDRCDSCGAQAYVSVLLSSGVLMFCGHHYAAAAEKLSLLNPTVVDERYKLTPKSKIISSNQNAF